MAAADVIRRTVREVDGTLPILSLKTFERHLDSNLQLWIVRAGATLFSVFGGLALGLAVVGVYGVKAYSVARRRREIGIRVALGASSGDVLRLVMREGSVVVAAGTVIGLALAWAAMRALAAALSVIASTSGRNTSTPVLLIGAPLLLAAVALLACYLPARESLRVDPIVALRQE